VDEHLGVTVIDRFTNLMMGFFESHVTPQSTMADMFESWDPVELGSTAAFRADLFKRNPKDVQIVLFESL
jgi:glycosylphosphatidylinositol transamidase (GPIT) subunit GPI8